MSKKVVSLGEILLRLSPSNYQRIVNSKSFEINYGGAEMNVAANLSILGIDSVAVTKVPDNEIGEAALSNLKSHGVNISYIPKGGERIGTYYLETGYSIRNSKVIYDRKDSSFAKSHISEYDVEKILEGADLFHVSGITLAISPLAFEIAETFMKKANEMGIKVSFDFNYRSKLWSLEEASIKIKKILPYVNIAFAGYLDFINILGFKSETCYEEDILKCYEELYPKVLEKYNFEYIASSIRKTVSASKNIYKGLVYDGKSINISKEYEIEIIDRVGSGDAFTTGFLYSYLMGKSSEYIVQFATASAAIKHTIHGDTNIINKSDIENLFEKDSFDVSR